MVNSEKRKLINKYMQKTYPMALIPEEDGKSYVVAFPDLPGCLSTGKTIQECIKMGCDAKRAWITSMVENENEKFISEPGTVSMADFVQRYAGNRPGRGKSLDMAMQLTHALFRRMEKEEHSE